MKTIKIISGILVVMMFLLTVTGNAQINNRADTLSTINSSTYKTAIGLRAGGTSGFAVKHFVSSKDALEGIFGVWPNALNFTGLYERYTSTGVNGLNIYYGGGAHATWMPGSIFYTNNERRYVSSSQGLGIGADGIVGMEYKIIPIPFAVSFDLKPFVEFTNYGDTYMGIDPSIGLKFTF
jgi:hypothetical protein